MFGDRVKHILMTLCVTQSHVWGLALSAFFVAVAENLTGHRRRANTYSTPTTEAAFSFAKCKLT